MHSSRKIRRIDVMLGHTMETWLILVAMVTTGAAHSVAVKLLCQQGLEAPIFVALLCLLGLSLSLLVCAFQRFQ